MINLNAETDLTGTAVGEFVQFLPEKGNKSHVIYLLPNYEAGAVIVDTVNAIRYSAECIQYLLNTPVGVCVGSLFVVNKRRVTVDHRFFFVREIDDFEDCECKQQSGLGGVYVYADPASNIMVIPASPTMTSLIVPE